MAAAVALAEAGAHVTLCARSLPEITAAADTIHARGGLADVLQLDVTDCEVVERAIAAAQPFQILVNNAGTNRPKTFTKVSVDDFDFIMNLNVRAAFFLTQSVVMRLIAAGLPGSVINITSQMGHVGGINRSVYCASKWAMEGFSRSVALDLAHYGIRVNTVAPTFIETPLTKPFFEDASFKDYVLSKIKLGRVGRVQDLTGAIIYLASDASSLMTGTSMIIDGGWTAE